MNKSVDYAEGMRHLADAVRLGHSFEPFMSWGSANDRANIRHLYSIANVQTPLDNINGVWIASQ